MGNYERTFGIGLVHELPSGSVYSALALPGLPPSGSLMERRARGVCSASELASASSWGSGNCDHCPCDSGHFLLSRLASAVSPPTPPLLPVLSPLLPVLRVLSSATCLHSHYSS